MLGNSYKTLEGNTLICVPDKFGVYVNSENEILCIKDKYEESFSKTWGVSPKSVNFEIDEYDYIRVVLVEIIKQELRDIDSLFEQGQLCRQVLYNSKHSYESLGVQIEYYQYWKGNTFVVEIRGEKDGKNVFIPMSLYRKYRGVISELKHGFSPLGKITVS